MATKEQQLITKLTRETQEGKIKWQLVSSVPTSLSQSQRLIDYPYKAKVGDKVFRIFKYESKFYIDEDRFDWTEGLRFELLHSDSDRSSYSFPEYNNLGGLYDEVRRQAAGIDRFLDDYLKDEGDRPPESDELF